MKREQIGQEEDQECSFFLLMWHLCIPTVVLFLLDFKYQYINVVSKTQVKSMLKGG